MEPGALRADGGTTQPFGMCFIVRRCVFLVLLSTALISNICQASNVDNIVYNIFTFLSNTCFRNEGTPGGYLYYIVILADESGKERVI